MRITEAICMLAIPLGFKAVVASGHAAFVEDIVVRGVGYLSDKTVSADLYRIASRSAPRVDT